MSSHILKIRFAEHASLKDSYGLFNAGLEAKASRAIDLHQNDRLDESAFKDLVRAAVALNRTKTKAKTPTTQKKRRESRK